MRVSGKIWDSKSSGAVHIIVRFGIALFALGIMLVLAFLGSESISEYARDGLSLSVKCVIPSVFPFLILSDLYVAYGMPEEIKPLAAFISKLIKIPKIALRPIICGWLCGFPVGMKITSELYSSGCLSRRDAERICAVSNTPSPAFVIGAVGCGMWGSSTLGIIMLICVLTSSVITGCIFRKCGSTENRSLNVASSFDFVESVKSAGVNSVTISSFIIIFSVITGLVGDLALPSIFLGIISAILELTNACRFLSADIGISDAISFMLTGLSLGFGGASVAMQSYIFIRNSDLRISRYLGLKLINGCICAVISLVGFCVYKSL